MILIVDLVRKIMVLVDTLQTGKGKSILVNYGRFLQALAGILDWPIRYEQWTFHYPKDVPLQSNSYDCGILICRYAEMLCKGKHVSIDEKSEVMRAEIRAELLEKSVGTK